MKVVEPKQVPHDIVRRVLNKKIRMFTKSQGGGGSRLGIQREVCQVREGVIIMLYYKIFLEFIQYI